MSTTQDTGQQLNFFLRRPILSTVISLLITLVGGLAIFALPIAQYPDLIPPQISVNVSYPGASAVTISDTVISPLENAINGVEDMLYMSSNAASGSGSGTINVYFKLGTDPDIALVNVNNKVNLAQNLLPADVRSQGVTVTKNSPAMLLIIALTSPSGRYDAVYLNNYLRNNIVDEVKRVAGVGDCEIFGAMDYSMRIWIDPDKLTKYQLQPSDVANAIRDQNAQFAPGRIGATPADPSIELTWQIDTQGRLVSPEEFGNVVIRAEADGSFLYVKDVARIELGGRDYSIESELNGHTAKMAGVYLLPGANAIETGRLVEEKLKELSQRFPDGVQYEIPFNTNIFVQASIDEVVKTLAEAMVLVFIVVYIFLQSWRATLIPCLAVPVSIIGTFAGMYALGYTINTLTLFGMVLAIGIVVDDAIVVLENVERIMRTEHKSPKEATNKAMQEVTGPVIAIVLVLCAVFVPVSFMGGLAGEMYKQFAITISISVILSGIVALTLTPALCGWLLKPHSPDHKEPFIFKWFNVWFANVTHRYVRIVRSVKNTGIVSMLLFVLMLVGMGYLFRVVPTSLVPGEDQGYILGMTISVDGQALSKTGRITDAMTKGLLQNPAIDNVVGITGLDLTSFGAKTNYSTFFIILKNWAERQTPETSPTALTQQFFMMGMRMPEALAIAFEPPPISGMSTTGGFDAYVQNRGTGSLDDLQNWTTKLTAAIQARPEIGSVQNLFSTSSPQYYANLDRERALAQGVSISSVFSVLQGTFGTTYVNDFNYVGRTFQVLMQADEDYRMLPETLADMSVRNDKGEMVPLNTLITLERRIAPQVVERYNGLPAAHLIGNPAPGYSTGQALAAIEEEAAKVLPSDYSLGWAGTALQEKLASADTITIFILALIMVFLILAAQYESWALPVAVLTAVPFGVFGAIVATYLRDLSNDVYFQVALVTLVGLAAKNAILIVEFAVEAWRGGRSLDVAAMHASRLRFRPIIMTSLAFIMGCVPLAISAGAGANSRHAIGTAVIGGMLAATCIATLFVPFFFKIIMQFSLWLQGKKDPHAPSSDSKAREEEENETTLPLKEYEGKN